MHMPELTMKGSFGLVGIQPHGSKDLVKQQANALLGFMPVACMPEHQEEVQVLQRKILFALPSGPGNYLVQIKPHLKQTASQ
ncbi:hypothetical protein DKS82_25280 [Salmonella enterica subsp. enterica serovar Haifa]|nr:hypothetical protein [Salmonella enterica subsp. enterica serovar Haifa]EBV4848835.1 hypothetical protein [Salmonella enterica subsp. enterica serovar Typhimurium]EBZ0661193.1 hypothetical protein [Salmonella enterica subsp. enterica serovar Haifa]